MPAAISSRPLLALLLGVLAAGVGGEVFVRGAVGLATWFRIPAGIVGATVAAFATSSPELAVAITAASEGRPAVALGDALGSNVVNLGIVLGLAIILAPMRPDRGDLRRDVPAALVAPALLGLLILDGRLARVEGAVLLLAFAVWLILAVRDARRARSAVGETLGASGGRSSLWSLLGGLVLLVLAGRLVVTGAVGIGEALGLAPFVIGVTLVAVATSTPELATTLVARVRGQDSVGIGTVLGSNVFNTLWIVGVAAMIEPIVVEPGVTWLGIAGGMALVLPVLSRGGTLLRWRGVMMVAGAVAVTAAVLIVGG
jgi:cation:H+ antiporter